MNTDNGRINFRTGLDNSLLRTQATEASSILRGITRSAADEGSRIDGIFKKLGATIVGTFSVAAATEFARKVVDVRQEIESLEISFKTLLGNEAKANAMFGEIRRFAVQTPMQLKDLAGAAQMMLSFNIDDSKILPYLKAIGDVSMGDSQKFQGLALAFSQMSSAGKLMGQDLMQMINAGFNPLAQMAEKSGKSIKELKDEMSAGKITAEMVQQAFLDATSEGGKFYGMLEAQSKGVKGSISNLQGAIDDMLNDIGTSSQGVITGVVNTATSLVKNYKEVADAILAIVASYGTYKAAVMVHEAINANVGAQVVASYAAEQEAINALVVAKQAESATTIQVETEDLKAAVAKGYLTQAQAEEIAATRLALAQKKEAVIQAEIQAKAELEAAVATQTAAKQKLEAARSNLYAIQAETQMTMAYGTEQEKSAALTKIHAAEKQVESAAIAEKVAAEKVETATTEFNNATTTKNTLLQGADAVSKGVNTTSTNFLTVATNALNKACKKLYAVMAANPYAIILAAVVALAYGIYKLITYENEEQKAQKRLSENAAEFEAEVAKENVQIDRLFDNLRRAKEGTEEYEKAKNAIMNNYGKYLNGLKDEVATLKDVEAAYWAVRDAALAATKERMRNEFLSEEITTMTKTIGDNVEKAYQMVVEKFGKDYADRNIDAIRRIMEGSSTVDRNFLKKFDRQSLQITGVDYDGTPMWDYVTVNDFQSLINSSSGARGTYRRAEEEANRRYGLSTPTETETASTVQNKGYWEGKKKEAQARLDALSDIAAMGAEGERIRQEIAGYDEKLKYYNTSKTTSSYNKAQNEAAQIAVQTAEREKKIQEQAMALAKAERDKERDVAQARIDGMREGLERELEQNKLNYQRLMDANADRQASMLEQLRDIAELQWENANPTAKKQGQVFDRSSVSADLLDLDKEVDYTGMDETMKRYIEQMRAQLAEYSRIAGETYARANKKSLEDALSDVLSYEQQREKIEKEYSQKRLMLYEDEVDEQGRILLDAEGNAIKKKDANGNMVLRQGVNQANVDELNRQSEEALKAIDEQFASRSEYYQAWCNEIANLSLKQLEDLLKQAQEELDRMKEDGDVDSQTLANQRAKVATLQKKVNTAKAQNDVSPKKRSIKEWEDLYKTLQECEREFESIGDAVGGVAGDIINTAGTIAASSLSMINGIVQLVNMSKIGIEGTAMAGATAISTMEKASVILTIISAAMQIAMTIINLFNKDNKKQEGIEALQERIDQLQWELDNASTLKMQEQLRTKSFLEEVRANIADARMELLGTKKGWEAFLVLCQRASNNTYVLNKSAEKLAKTYANMAYTADKALGSSKYADATAQLENIAKQQVMINDQIALESSKKKSDASKITEYEQKIAELGQQAVSIINEMVEDIIGNSAEDLASELGDAFIEAFQAGEDAAEAWGKKVNEVVADIMKKMLVAKFLEEPLGEIFDKYKGQWFKDGQFVGLQAVIDSMSGFADDLNQVGSDFAEIWDNLPDSVKNMFTVTSDAEREASQKGIATASQESVDELNGRATAIQSHTYSISENTKLLLSTTQAILRSVMNIDSNTDGLSARMVSVEANVKEMKNTLNDIALKGLKLK